MLLWKEGWNPFLFPAMNVKINKPWKQSPRNPITKLHQNLNVLQSLIITHVIVYVLCL